MSGDVRLPVLRGEEVRRDRLLRDALGDSPDGLPRTAVRESATSGGETSLCEGRSAGRPPLGEAFGDRIEDLRWIDDFIESCGRMSVCGSRTAC